MSVATYVRGDLNFISSATGDGGESFAVVGRVQIQHKLRVAVVKFLPVDTRRQIFEMSPRGREDVVKLSD